MRNAQWNIIFKNYLKDNGIEPRDVSNKTGIPYSTVTSYLNGTRSPSESNKEKLYKFGFDVYSAMYGKMIREE